MPDRLDILEQTVANLVREVRALREVVDRLDGTRPATIMSTERQVGTVPLETPSAPLGEAERRSFRDPLIVAKLEADRREAERRTTERRSGAERRNLDLESLVGRYGTLALASLTILLGAGAFLSWAIAHGKIGPGVRV